MRIPAHLLLTCCLFSFILSGCPTRTDDDDTTSVDLPEIEHDPVTSAVEVTEVPIVAEAFAPAESDDAFTLVVTLYYRVAGEGSYTNVSMEPTDAADGFEATIPADVVTTADVEYYLSALWGAELATHPDGAPDTVHRIEVGAAPLAEPEPLRARYDAGSDTVELTWTPPASSAFAGYTVDARIGAEEPELVCDGGEPDAGCSVPAAGVYDVQYATWTVTVTDGDGNGASASAVTDGLHLVQDIWVKEHLPEELAFGTGELEFNLPFGVAARDGSIHVAEQGNHRLQTITDEGDFLGFVGAFGGGTGAPGEADGDFNAAMDVTIGPDGLIYAADHTNARVQVFDGVTRQFQFSFGTLGTAEGQLRFPTGLAFDGNGDLHVTESVNARVSVFDVAGDFLHSYDSVDGTPLDFPARIAWWPELDAMVISDGQLLRLHALGEGGSDATWDLLADFAATTTLGGVCITQWGEAIVAVDDPEQTGPSDGHVLLKVDADGVAFDTVGGWGIGDEDFWRPVACAVDEHGDVYVADGLNHRIKILGP